MPVEQDLLRRRLASAVDAGVKVNGAAEDFMDRLQTLIREARSAVVQLGATYTQTHEGIVWPARAGNSSPYAYRSLSDFDKDLSELMRQYGLHELTDAQGRKFKLHAVLAFDVQPYVHKEEPDDTLEAVNAA